MSTNAQTTQLLLVRDRAAAPRPAAGAPKVRRYRLARVPVDARHGPAGRHDHLKRSYD